MREEGVGGREVMEGGFGKGGGERGRCFGKGGGESGRCFGKGGGERGR